MARFIEQKYWQVSYWGNSETLPWHVNKEKPNFLTLYPVPLCSPLPHDHQRSVEIISLDRKRSQYRVIFNSSADHVLLEPPEKNIEINKQHSNKKKYQLLILRLYKGESATITCVCQRLQDRQSVGTDAYTKTKAIYQVSSDWKF